MTDFCVIGSGPAAISAAVALTRRGLQVAMLDAGRALDPARRQVVARMAAQRSDEWVDADIESLKAGVEASPSGIPLKRLYGSDFPFDPSGAAFDLAARNAGIRPSYARGGLSTVWGTGMLPFHRDDLAGWPAEAIARDCDYAGVLSFVPLSGCADALAKDFPLYTANVVPMPPTAQGRAFLRDAARHKSNGAHIAIGQSRLAVDAARCERCGLCLYGCPYGLIWSAAATLEQLQTLPNFRYEPGFVVEALREEAGRVRIEGRDLATQTPRIAHASRVLLGAGAVNSTAILLASLNEFGETVRLADSFYFLLPLLRFRGAPGVATERLHTLAQAFILLRDPAVCREFVHFSIYGFNDLMIPSLRASLGAPGRMKALASRALVAGGYLHSRLSPGIAMTLELRSSGDRGRIVLEGESSAEAIPIAKRAGRRLLRESTRLRALPVTPAMRFSPPGRGFHTGASFPMRTAPARHESDIEGRPFGFDRVHLIDASCLPSIPATTITLPVMANAWRIAHLAAARA